MEYQTLYRRWRPQGFSDFVGQSHVVTTLTNAIQGNRVAHAYLFTGPRGTGKTSTAKIFAKALNCDALKGAEPCGQCPNCLRITDGTFMDVFEIDGASNRGIDEIRDLREKVKFAPAQGKYKIYIIDEVHMLTAEAFNALLKTLEEPPSYVIFILATTEVHKLPATILSRCQRFDFKRFTISEIQGRLEHILKSEEVPASGAALQLIAEYSEGGMRDALSLLEQALMHSKGKLEESNVRAILGLIDQEVISGITQAIASHDTKLALTILNEIHLDGKDLFQFGRSLISHFRELLLEIVGAEPGKVEFTPAALIMMIETLSAATNEVKKSSQSTLPLELALIKLTAGLTRESDLESRVERLEALLKNSKISFAEEPGLAVKAPPAIEKAPTPKSTTTSGAASGPKKTDATPAPVANNKETSSKFEWNLFLEAVKQKKRTLAALVQEGKPLEINESELVLGFPPNLKFHLDNLPLPQNKTLLETIFKDCFGTDIRMSFIPLPSETKPDGDRDKPQAGQELLNKAVQLFGGEVLPLSKEERSK